MLFELFHSSVPQFPLLQNGDWDPVLPCKQLRAVLMHCCKTELREVCGVGVFPPEMPGSLLSHFTVLMEGENTPEFAMVWKEKVILIIKLLFL